MNIIHVALVITLVPDDVLPKPSLPNTPLSFLSASDYSFILISIVFRGYFSLMLTLDTSQVTLYG